jgi:V8-like Glu-specific endopeptidase
MPIVVEVLSGSRRGHRNVFNQPVVTLGRHPGNDVAFDAAAEPLVSAFHAEIRELGPGRLVLEDRGSSNGTFVEGRRVTRVELVGRFEVRLAAQGPRVAVMPLSAIPVQAADAGTAAAGGWPTGIDPLVLTPTADARAGGERRRMDRPPQGAFAEGRPAPEVRVGTAGAVGRGVPEPAPPRRLGTTAYIRAVAGEAVRRTSRRWLAVSLGLGIPLAGAVVLMGLLLAGVVSFGEETGGGAGRPPADGPAAPDPEGAGARQAGAELTPKAIKAVNADAIVLHGAVVGGRSEGFCSGFAMTRRILATNAHCVVEMLRIWKELGEGRGVFAFQNERPGTKYRVLYAMMHPDYRDEDSPRIYPDVGLVLIEGEVDRTVRLAGPERAAAVEAGDPIYLLGFPGTLNNTDSPVATLTEGIVSRVTDLSQRKADPATSLLIQHSAFTTKGTSGSPLFDDRGEVVGINTGYYRGESQQQRLDPVTGRMHEERITTDLQSYAIGMRVDLLHDLLALLCERLGRDAGDPPP